MQISKKHSLIFYHLIFWLFYFTLYALNEFASIPEIYFFSLFDVLNTQIPGVIITYMGVYIFEKYTVPSKPVQLFVGIILIFILDLIIWYFVSYEIRPYVKSNPPAPLPFGLRYHIIGVAYHASKFLIFGFAYAFTVKMIKHKRKLNQLEKERLEVEYAFLRSQINPHFLNNTLNLFYAKALPLSMELSDGIMTLSQIMRYSLDRNETNRMVMLADELEHVRNVIKLNQMRFSNRLQIDMNFEFISSSIQIVPLIIITIVENILKHGDCSLPEDPARIHLYIAEDGCFIHLNTYNKKSEWAAEHSSGIGVENIKKRIAHHYGKDYQLLIDDNDTFYSLLLKLPVFHKVQFYTSPGECINANHIDWSKLFAKKKFNLS